MSQSSSDNGDPPALGEGGHPDYPEGRPFSGGAVGTGGYAHGAAAPRTTVVPSAQELDYRRRSLRSQATDDVPAPPGRTDHRQQRRLAPLLAKVAVFVAVAAFAVLFLRAFVVQPFAVPGDAMAPTLQAGDRILVLKSGLLEGPIHSGEIVVFHPRHSLPCAVAGGRDGDLVLRVVALPGEVIRSVGNTILLDGRPLRERGLVRPPLRPGRLGSQSAAPRRPGSVLRDGRQPCGRL